MDAIPWSELEGLERELTAELTSILDKAAKKAEQYLPEGVDIKFDVTNPEALKWIEEHAAELVTDNIVGTSKDAIREIIQEAFEDGLAPREAAKKIKEHIGLLPQHTDAVESYRRELEEAGRSPADIDRLVAKYTDQLLSYRAELIARTETMKAANEGQRQLWNQGLADGSLEAGAWEREWIITPDDRLCPYCQDMEGQTAPIDGSYEGDGGEGPPLHPMCRCVETLVRVEAAAAA